MDIIHVPVSPGEVLDKITILEIKSERIFDADKLVNVKRELELLQASWSQFVDDDETVRRIHSELKTINEALWEIEDDIRDKERAREFDQVFIDLARSVYVTNDQRANAKKELNVYLGSEMVEEKSYQDYIREQVGRVADQISDHVDKIEAIGFRGGNRDRSRVGLI